MRRNAFGQGLQNAHVEILEQAHKLLQNLDVSLSKTLWVDLVQDVLIEI